MLACLLSADSCTFVPVDTGLWAKGGVSVFSVVMFNYVDNWKKQRIYTDTWIKSLGPAKLLSYIQVSFIRAFAHKKVLPENTFVSCIRISLFSKENTYNCLICYKFISLMLLDCVCMRVYVTETERERNNNSGQAVTFLQPNFLLNLFLPSYFNCGVSF